MATPHEAPSPIDTSIEASQALEQLPELSRRERVQARWAELQEAHMWARLPGAAGSMVLAAFWEPNL